MKIKITDADRLEAAPELNRRNQPSAMKIRITDADRLEVAPELAELNRRDQPGVGYDRCATSLEREEALAFEAAARRALELEPRQSQAEDGRWLGRPVEIKFQGPKRNLAPTLRVRAKAIREDTIYVLVTGSGEEGEILGYARGDDLIRRPPDEGPLGQWTNPGGNYWRWWNELSPISDLDMPF